MGAKKLSVKLFGRFSAKYGDEVLTFGRQGDSKFGQLFQILMTEPEQGVSKRNIVEVLYNWDKVGNPNASLNNTIFRLRKYFEESPLPSGEYLYLQAGILQFSRKIEIESDAWEFEKASRKFKEESDKWKKAELCEKACDLYRGEFLPHLSNEQWVIDKGQHYQKLYFEMMEYLFSFLVERGDYRKLKRLSERVIELYPNEGWEIWQVDSLNALNQYKEAKILYQKIVTYIQKTGNFLSKEQREHLQKTGSRLHFPEGTEEDIREGLLETIPCPGAYCCTLQGFSDCYRMLKRVMKREKLSFGLLLCTILDSNGKSVNDQDYCKKQGEKLREVFQKYLRLGDIYTKYCESQYLLLCVGADKENISEIGARIDMDFRKLCGGRGGISCRLLEDGTGG